MTDPRLLKLFLCVLCITAALCAYNSAHAQALETEDVTPAIDKGIEYLISQAAEDGSIAHHRRHQHAMTSLSIMALTAIGHQPTDPTPQGQALRHALDFMLDEKRLTEEGYFGRLDNSRMYGHGICALMLCEMLGMGVDEQQDQLIRDRAERAIDLILKAQAVRKREQRFHGGWRYEPNASDADLSVTVWQLMALRAGKSAGIDVPAKAIDDAVAYLERSYKESGRKGSGAGGFGYEPGHGPRYATTAAGLLAMQVCGRYEHEQVAGAVAFLREKGVNRGEQWFLYGSYYFSVGMDQAGQEHGDYAAEQLWNVISKMQRSDGSWTGNGQEHDPVYSTSLAILALSVRYHYLPIYQR